MKKIYALLGFSFVLLSSGIFSSTAVANIINLPADFTTNIGSSTTDVIGTLSPFTILIIGILLAGVVIEIIISAIRHK